MSKLVTIYGGSGFVGRYIARRMAKAGWRVRVAVRRPNEALHVRPYGAVGQVEPILCNIRNDASVRAALKGADAVINCVGTFDKGGKNNFDAVQTEGAGRIATIAAAEGVGRMVHISAIGADATSGSDYSRTKGLGEAAVLAAFPNAVILRPSVIFGSEDGFFNRFGGMTRMGPVLPVVGGNTRFQPVFVDAGGRTTSAPGAEHTFLCGQYHGCLVRFSQLLHRAPCPQPDSDARSGQRPARRQCGVGRREGPGRSGNRTDQYGVCPAGISVAVPPVGAICGHHGLGQEPAQSPDLNGPGRGRYDTVRPFLGVFEDLTEFIPVSSTGHILLAGHFIGFESAGKTF